MKFFVGVTDYDWYALHASKSSIEEVNFWRPSSQVGFGSLQTGEPFLFKLHSPRNYIVGGGFFTKFLRLPVSLAWEAFGEGNGARSLIEVRRRIAKYRREPMFGNDDPVIGCIILAEPFFLPEEEWIAAPADFALNIVSGKRYDTDTSAGVELWAQVAERLARRPARVLETQPATLAAIEGPRFGRSVLVMPRLGQGGFRVLVTDAYAWRCAITGERTRPVLEAAHTRPYADGGTHELSNGLLLRSDLHRLFDKGYIGIDPGERRVMVSKRIREEFENGHDYYQLESRQLAIPGDPVAVPSQDSLLYHAEHVFR